MNPLTFQQRQHQLAIRAALIRRLIPLWHMMDPKTLDKAFPAWLAVVTPLVQDARHASAGLAATYLRAMRAEAGVAGKAPLEVAGRAPTAQITASMSATSLAAIRTALGAGQNINQAMRTGFVASSGAASRLALQGGRSTIVDTVKADRHAIGWERVTSGAACDFCTMLADRGAVYREDTADFEAHDHCACMAEPLYQLAAA